MTTPLTPADAARLLADLATDADTKHGRYATARRLRDAAPALAEALASHSDCISREVHEAAVSEPSVAEHCALVAARYKAERDALRTDLAEAVRLLRGVRRRHREIASYASSHCHSCKMSWPCESAETLDAFLAAHPQGEQT